MPKIKDVYKIVPNSRMGRSGYYEPSKPSDSYSVGTSQHHSIKDRLKFTTNRQEKYSLYDQMDRDVDVSRALDTTTDEMTPLNTDSNLPFDINYNNDIDKEVDEQLVVTIRSALHRWCRINKLDNRLWSIIRSVLKYGDCFLIKYRNEDELHPRWKFVDARDVIGIAVNTNTGDIAHYQIKATSSALTKEQKEQITVSQKGVMINKSDMIHFSLHDETKAIYPFGESILSTLYRTFKQLEMLEDALIIYRVVRAPERRVFYVDVGKMSPAKSSKYLEKIKNDIRQKRMPIIRDGETSVDSAYNPESMLEDIFLAQTESGRGSKIDMLQGGCLDLSTMIPLLDGRELSLAELIAEYNEGKENWAYSYSNKGEPLPGKISWAGVTHSDAQVYELLLDNGEKITATADHKFPVWGRGATRLDELRAGDSIISHNTNEVVTARMSSLIVDRSNPERVLKHVESGGGTLVFSQDMLVTIRYYFDGGTTQMHELMRQLNHTQQFVDLWRLLNTTTSEFTDSLLVMLLQSFGYADWNDFTHRRLSNLRITEKSDTDHSIQVISITKLSKPMDVGTLTIDRDEEIHSFHNFALCAGVVTFNSNLGELDDLYHFQDKIFRGLNIPLSYMGNSRESDGAQVSDGRVGTAYIQELRFVRYVMRLQELVDGVFDAEFKMFLESEQINVHEDEFSLKFNPPQNFAIYRELELAGDLLNTFQSANDIPFMSKRYALMKYMNWSEEDIQLNETLLKQELGITGDKEVDVLDPNTDEPTGEKVVHDELAQVYRLSDR